MVGGRPPTHLRSCRTLNRPRSDAASVRHCWFAFHPSSPPSSPPLPTWQPSTEPPPTHSCLAKAGNKDVKNGVWLPFPADASPINSLTDYS